MAKGHEGNGYVRLQSLVMVAVPVTVAVSGSIALFVNLSIAPILKDVAQNHEDVMDIRRQLVPRQEHDRDWSSTDQRFADIQRQLDQARHVQEQIYTPSDAFKRIEERLDRIEERTATERHR